MLERHPYRNAILGDLEEAERSLPADSPRARRRHDRDVLCTAAALVPQYRTSAGTALWAGGVAMPAYALCVSFAAPSAFALTRRMNAVEGGIAFAAVYFSAVAAAAIVGCVVVSLLARRVIIPAMTIFLALAVCMGVLHVVASTPAERWFRVIKVLVFLATSAAGFLAALAWEGHRRCHFGST